MAVPWLGEQFHECFFAIGLFGLQFPSRLFSPTSVKFLPSQPVTALRTLFVAHGVSSMPPKYFREVRRIPLQYGHHAFPFGIQNGSRRFEQPVFIKYLERETLPWDQRPGCLQIARLPA